MRAASPTAYASRGWHRCNIVRKEKRNQWGTPSLAMPTTRRPGHAQVEVGRQARQSAEAESLGARRGAASTSLATTQLPYISKHMQDDPKGRGRGGGGRRRGRKGREGQRKARAGGTRGARKRGGREGRKDGGEEERGQPIKQPPSPPTAVAAEEAPRQALAPPAAGKRCQHQRSSRGSG